MVTGGYVSGDKDTVTTELSINEGAWSTVSSGDLPTPRDGLRGVSLNNKVFMTGNQFTYDYVKLKIGYFSNRIPVWEGIFTLENLT